MSEKRLHIISFDVPLPANYGGAIDVFYRLKALHQLGVKITLHCFEYGRGRSADLEQFAEKVIYYKRRKSIFQFFSTLPFIVNSRKDPQLLKNLLSDDDPILFEGLHTTYFLSDERLKERIKIVRTHNIEHDYYEALAKQSKGFRQWFFKSESKKLARFEPQLKYASRILAIKKTDAEYFNKYCDAVHVLDACSATSTSFETATEPYCLFQGNLSVPENEKGANWLIDRVFLPYKLTNKLIIAGKDPSRHLISRCKTLGIELVANPTFEKMDALSAAARIHVLYSEQDTGIKLKVINALRTSGVVVANSSMLRGTHFEHLCQEASGPENYAELVQKYIETPIESEQLKNRQIFVNEHLNPVVNCRIILESL